MENDGFVGRYSAPTPRRGTAPRGAAVRRIRRRHGGGPLAFSLAAEGFPTLNIAYFNAPGLPATLSNIPLEYFAGALTWLAAQPGVDPSRLWVMGDSRGGEAAVLLGATYPDLVYGVAALVPSNVVNCSNPCAGASLDARWSGRAVHAPRSTEPDRCTGGGHRGGAHPGAGADALRRRRPHLRIRVTTPTPIAARLQAGGQVQPHRFLAYPDAGHGVGTLLPYQPARPMPSLEGTTPAANWNAREQAWPLVLDFLGDPT